MGLRAWMMGLVLTGCLARRDAVDARTFQGEPIPTIAVAAGFEQRIALMDRYRLHDEDRKLMMARPRVWVEEVPDEPAGGFGNPARVSEEGAAPEALPASSSAPSSSAPTSSDATPH